MARLPRLWIQPMGLSRRLDRVFDDFFSDWPESRTFGRTDVYEKDGSIFFETELPGAKREDINIKVEDHQLVISGETKREEKVEEENYFRMGRSVGTFQRTYPLPDEVSEPNKIEAKFQDGILKVRVPLSNSIKEKEKPVEIKVS